jgi:hypothetical protein
VIKKKKVSTRVPKLKGSAEKPPGIRVEDLEPWSIFKYIDADEEIHVALPDARFRRERGKPVWGSAVQTIRILEDGTLIGDMLHCGMDKWDYKIELLDKTHAFRLEVVNKAQGHRLSKQRGKRK